MKDLIIIGAGSVGSHIAHNLDEYLTGYRLLGFLDDDPDKIDLNLFGYPVIGNIDTFFSKDFKNVEVIIGIAFPNTKKKIIEKLDSVEFKGPYTLEIEGIKGESLTLEQTKERLKKSVDYIKQYL